MSWLPGANPAKVMSSIIRRRNGVIVISLRSKIGRGPPTQPREEILSTVQISDAALTLGEAVSPTPRNSLPHGEMQGEKSFCDCTTADKAFAIRDLGVALGRCPDGRQGNFDNPLTSISCLPYQHFIYQIIIA